MEYGNEKVIEFAVRAFSSPSANGLDYAAIAQAHTLNWNATSAREAFKRALVRAPNNPDILDAYAVFCAQVGDFETAIKYGEQADSLIRNNRFGVVLILAGAYERAQQWYEQAAEEIHNNALFLFELSRLASRRGDYTQALGLLAEVETKIDNRSRYLLAYAYKLARSSADVERVMGHEDLAQIDQGRIIQAIVYLSVGQNGAALKELELSINAPTIAAAETAFIKQNSFSDPVLDQTEFSEVRKLLAYGQA